MESDALDEATNNLRSLLRQRAPDLLLQAECGGGLDLPTPLPWGFASVPTLYELANIAERELEDLKAQQEQSTCSQRVSHQQHSGDDIHAAGEPCLWHGNDQLLNVPDTTPHGEGFDNQGQQPWQERQPREEACGSPLSAALDAMELPYDHEGQPPATKVEPGLGADGHEGLAPSVTQRTRCGSGALTQDPGGTEDLSGGHWDASPGICNLPPISNEASPGLKELAAVATTEGAAAAIKAAAVATGVAVARDVCVEDWRPAYEDEDDVMDVIVMGDDGAAPNSQQDRDVAGNRAEGGASLLHSRDMEASHNPGLSALGPEAAAELKGVQLEEKPVPEPKKPYACRAFLDSLQQSRTFRSPHCEGAMAEAMGMAELYEGLTGSTLGPPPGRRELESFRALLKDHINARWALEAVKQGVAAAKRGVYTDAHKAYARALELDPANVEAYVARGAAYANQRAFADAERDLRRALELDPDHRNAATYLDAVLRHVAELSGILEVERRQALARQQQQQLQWDRSRRSLGEAAEVVERGRGAAEGRDGPFDGDFAEGRRSPQGQPPIPGRLPREESAKVALRGCSLPGERLEGRRRRGSDDCSDSTDSSSGSEDGSDETPGHGQDSPLQPATDDIRRALEVVLKARKPKKKSKHKKPKKKHKKSKRRKHY